MHVCSPAYLRFTHTYLSTLNRCQPELTSLGKLTSLGTQDFFFPSPSDQEPWTMNKRHSCLLISENVFYLHMFGIKRLTKGILVCLFPRMFLFTPVWKKCLTLYVFLHIHMRLVLNNKECLTLYVSLTYINAYFPVFLMLKHTHVRPYFKTHTPEFCVSNTHTPVLMFFKHICILCFSGTYALVSYASRALMRLIFLFLGLALSLHVTKEACCPHLENPRLFHLQANANNQAIGVKI